MVSLAALVSEAEGYSSVEHNNVRRDRKPIERGERWNGFFKVRDTTAEHGRNVSPALWVSPRRVSGGFIELHFPRVRIPPDAAFRAQLGFIKSAKRSRDGVDFVVEVAYYVKAERKVARVAHGHKNYTGSLLTLDVDLAPLAAAADGGQVSVTLHVGAGANSDSDTLLWINPRIESAEADPYRFELQLPHFGINDDNERGADEPTVLIRGAYFSGERLDLDKLADAGPKLIRPKRISINKGRVPPDRQVHPFEWRPVRAHKLLGPDEALALNRLTITAVFTERDDSDRPERDRAEALASDLVRLRLQSELRTAILRETRNLTRRARPRAFDGLMANLPNTVFQETVRGYAQTVSRGGDTDDFVGAARFDASLLDLLLAGREGTFVQLSHHSRGEGRYQLTGRIVLSELK